MSCLVEEQWPPRGRQDNQRDQHSAILPLVRDNNFGPVRRFPPFLRWVSRGRP